MASPSSRLVAVLAAAAALLAPHTAAGAVAHRGHLYYVNDLGQPTTSDAEGRRVRSARLDGYASTSVPSPDHRWVAWDRQSDRLDDVAFSDVWVARADLTGARRVASVPGLLLYAPTWSPDSRRLAFVQGYPAGYFGVGYQAHLWVTDRSGGVQRPVAVLPGAAEQPEWAPRGGAVVVVVDGEESSAALAVVDVDAPAPLPRVITPAGLLGIASPHWAPDARRLSFTESSTHGLYVVGADGTGLRRVAQTESYFWNGGGAWSPDGRTLAYCPTSGGYFFGGVSGAGLFTLDVTRARSRPRQVDAVICTRPAWSPDGGSLAYARAASDRWELAVVDRARPFLAKVVADHVLSASLTWTR